ncbi:MAG: hypothetical protein L3J89_09365 [Gammaproteobacteria bacterium]|nr:hypothetical protein [Gammaproteobacteria bacterium]
MAPESYTIGLGQGYPVSNDANMKVRCTFMLAFSVTPTAQLDSKDPQ